MLMVALFFGNIKAGIPINVTQSVMAPNYLPAQYAIAVAVDVLNTKKQPKIHACAVAFVNSSLEPDFDLQIIFF